MLVRKTRDTCDRKMSQNAWQRIKYCSSSHFLRKGLGRKTRSTKLFVLVFFSVSCWLVVKVFASSSALYGGITPTDSWLRSRAKSLVVK